MSKFVRPLSFLFPFSTYSLQFYPFLATPLVSFNPSWALKSFLIRNGATINGRSWWSNVGNFETDLEQMVFTKKTGFINLEFDSATEIKNLSSEGKTFVDGYGVTGV